MDNKYSVGDKVVTTSKWDNGMGNTVPKGSIVEIIFFNGYSLGANVYTCLYNGERYIYEEGWLGEIQNQPKTGDWIPCSDRLPEMCKPVLVTYHRECDNFDKVVTAYLEQDGEWRIEFGGSCGFESVIAWQSLPEPYSLEVKN